MTDILFELQQCLISGGQSSSEPNVIDLPALSRILSFINEEKKDQEKKKGQEPFSLEAYGTWGSLPRLIAALTADNLQRPVLYLAAHIPDAFEAQDDLETFLTRPVQLFPAAEAHETDLDPKSEIASERLRICQNLHSLTTHHHSLTTHHSPLTTHNSYSRSRTGPDAARTRHTVSSAAISHTQNRPEPKL